MITKEPIEYAASELQLKQHLGYGTFGHVFEVEITRYGKTKKAALKKLINRNNDNGIQNLLKKEATTISKLNHPNIVKLFGICTQDPNIGMILELCEGGSLSSVFEKWKDEIPLVVNIDWALQVARGMKYLARVRLVHRDLKCDNVLVAQSVCYCPHSATSNWTPCEDCEKSSISKLHLKITDFGFTKNVMEQQFSFSGSPGFIALELAEQEDKAVKSLVYTEATDVWAFGVVMWEMMARKALRCGLDFVREIRENEGQILKTDPTWPQEISSFMKQCWNPDPMLRPKFAELVDDLNNYKLKVEGNSVSIDSVARSEQLEVEEAAPRNWRFGELFSKKFLMLVSCCLISLQVFILAAVLAYSLFRDDSPSELVTTTTSISTTSVAPTTSSFSLPRYDEFCPKNYTFFQQTGYCYRLNTEPLFWSSAKSTCQEENSQLASIHSLIEDCFIYGMYRTAMLTDNVHKTLEYMWIPLLYSPSNEAYQWDDGSSLDYNGWKVGEPADELDRFGAYVYSGGMGWKATYDYPMVFICRQRAVGAPKVLQMIDNKRKSCEKGYTYMEQTGLCYQMMISPRSFASATTICSNNNATLPSINSEAENMFLIGFYYHEKSRMDSSLPEVETRFDIWIGWRNGGWVGGSPVDYTNFLHPPKMDSFYAIRINSGKWLEKETVCSFVCVKKPRN